MKPLKQSQLVNCDGQPTPKFCKLCGTGLVMESYPDSFCSVTGKQLFNYKLYCPSKKIFLTWRVHTEQEYDEKGERVIYAPYPY